MILTLMHWEMLYKILLEILLRVISSFIVSTHNERLHCSSVVRDFDKLETSTRHHPSCPSMSDSFHHAVAFPPPNPTGSSGLL